MNTKLLMIYFLSASSVYKLIKRAVRMALRVKALAANPVDLSPVPGTHVVEEKTDSHKLCSDVCV